MNEKKKRNKAITQAANRRAFIERREKNRRSSQRTAEYRARWGLKK